MYAGSHYCYTGTDEYEEMEIENEILNLQDDQITNTNTNNNNNNSLPQPAAPLSTSSKPSFLSSLFGRSAPAQSNAAPSTNSNRVAPPPAAPKPIKGKREKKLVKKANTNILNINLGTLSNEPTIATGDPLHCKGCDVIYSHINNFTEVKNPDGTTAKNIPTGGGVKDGVWTCEFCGEPTPFNLDSQEIPTSNIIDYVLEPAPVTTTTTANENTPMVEANPDSSLVVFCIDVSGSMQRTYDVPQGVYLHGSKTKSNYISRLQCVQYGIEAQLETLEKDYPNRRIAIIAFNASVVVIGDGTGKPITIPSSDLYDTQKLIDAGTKCTLDQPISKTRALLLKKVFAMDADGSTALGPGIAVAVGMTAAIPGSTIVLATDGLSNIGVGSVESSNVSEAAKFYDEIGQIAKKNGTTISVLTIKGTDTKLEQIGQLAELTNGNVDIVDPLKIKEDFKAALELPILATHCSIKVRLHRGLYISDPLSPTVDQSSIFKEIGNVNQETIVAFDYGTIKDRKIDESLKSLPFQLQITYTTLKGMKCLRVMTMTQETTKEKQLAEEHANIEEIGINMVQNSSKVAASGDYNKSRAVNLQSANMMKRIMTNQQQQIQSPVIDQQKQQYLQKQQQNAQVWLQQAQTLETTLTTNLQKESLNDHLSEEEVYRQRKSERNDETATMLFNMKQMNSRKARKKPNLLLLNQLISGRQPQQQQCLKISYMPLLRYNTINNNSSISSISNIRSYSTKNSNNNDDVQQNSKNNNNNDKEEQEFQAQTFQVITPPPQEEKMEWKLFGQGRSISNLVMFSIGFMMSAFTLGGITFSLLETDKSHESYEYYNNLLDYFWWAPPIGLWHNNGVLDKAIDEYKQGTISPEGVKLLFNISTFKAGRQILCQKGLIETICNRIDQFFEEDNNNNQNKSTIIVVNNNNNNNNSNNNNNNNHHSHAPLILKFQPSPVTGYELSLLVNLSVFNGIDVSPSTKAKISELRKKLPDGFKFQRPLDNDFFIERSQLLTNIHRLYENPVGLSGLLLYGLGGAFYAFMMLRKRPQSTRRLGMRNTAMASMLVAGVHTYRTITYDRFIDKAKSYPGYLVRIETTSLLYSTAMMLVSGFPHLYWMLPSLTMYFGISAYQAFSLFQLLKSDLQKELNRIEKDN
ncbi:type A von Willebrand factor domain-containing protein [Heterostelium album PN500]|uniref:Type A von Willebrand factor domain-containing protein n=1 Tax=Heterostelium pallidum (strain ATCC 26659 / Pp 5 / PN500) TaxID=670386 RepID=D3BRB5_HETP5|nr:type A von Willebrand factor domain-containing protein [Heterostelium album PN500]EFA75947.1 type A von Willebrand factor domain-containing protein [Heterostelium album PN500]|eukprot:XP_020428081.1 type A von Willebrand factor domain-containing protein [Heterostelium album PN500]